MKKIIKNVVSMFGLKIYKSIYKYKIFQRTIVRDLKKNMKYVGVDVRINPDTHIIDPQNISIGDRSSVGAQCFIQATGGISIGKDTMIAPRVAIWTSNHIYTDKEKTIREQGSVFRKVIIEDDVWIGYGAIILPGAILRKGCVVGAGSVVTGEVEEYSLVAGNPARFIRYRQ